jgi:hypothetical protein
MKTLCVSLETAKALKTKGWNKPTEFGWFKWAYHEHDLGYFNTIAVAEKLGWEGWECLFAPTAEEVLRELPYKLNGKEYGEFLYIELWATGVWQIQYRVSARPIKTTSNKSLSEAAAQMWIWCVDNHYITKEAKP